MNKIILFTILITSVVILFLASAPVFAQEEAAKEIKVYNPVCWPQDECNGACQAGPGKCWSTSQPAECPPEWHYCYDQPTGVRIAVPIAGVNEVRDIGSYIALLYNYLVGAAVLLAIVMIMYGGFRWIFQGGGGVGKVTEAKKTIIGAVIGLVIALFSYTLLNTINPALVRLEMPKIKMIRPILFDIPIVRCWDYKTQQECLSNSAGLEGGCQWKTTGFGEEQCSSLDPEPGDSGTYCDSGGCNTGLTCTAGKIVYLGPSGIKPEGNVSHRYCTDGKVDSPCSSDEECTGSSYSGGELHCDKKIKTCVGDTLRPEMAECDKGAHIQCSSGLCEGGVCAKGQDSRDCGSGLKNDEPDQSDCATGYRCQSFGVPLQSLSVPTHNLKWRCCNQSLPRYRCKVNCQKDTDCSEEGKPGNEFCWDETDVWYQGTESDPEAIKKNATIPGLMNHCVPVNVNKPCMVQAQCGDGFVCVDNSSSGGIGGFYSFNDPVVKSVFDFGSESIGFNTDYAKIFVGECVER